jgi:SseB protein N-terminal domain
VRGPEPEPQYRRQVPAPQLPLTGPFAADDGSADPAVLAVLGAYVTGRCDLRELLGVLRTARVLVPVLPTAVETEVGADGRTVENVVQLATVTVTGRDGRRALPVFTSTVSMAAWDPVGRPFPTSAPAAAAGAFAEGAEALLVDFAGPFHVVVEGAPMRALAEGRAWVPADEDPEVRGAVQAALADLPGLASVDIRSSAEADLALTLHLDGSDAHHAREVAQEAAARLARVDLLRVRLDRGLDLAAVAD